MKDTKKYFNKIFKKDKFTAMAPMQNITNLQFMKVISKIGPPDCFFTEFIRVYENSIINPKIIECISSNPTKNPVVIQLLGENIDFMKKTVKKLQENIAINVIDLNMGCPAPKIFKKNVGGGLLINIEKTDKLLYELRSSINCLFTVKIRTGFDNTNNFSKILNLINKNNIDLLSVHGRTVKEMYGPSVNYDLIRKAVEFVQCPVLANGNIDSPEKAQSVLDYTGARGVMIGRSCIKNPWIFRQCNEYLEKKDYYKPTLNDVYYYIKDLNEVLYNRSLCEQSHINYLKKYLNFISKGIDSDNSFLIKMRKLDSIEGLMNLCKNLLIINGNSIKKFNFLN